MPTTTTFPGGGNVPVSGSNRYGNGTTTASSGENTVIHFYDRAGVKAANRVNVYGQFADRKSMPKKMGKTFKISKFLHIYDRAINEADFEAKGYLSHRDIDAVNLELANDVSLGEGALAVNKRTLQKITMETSLARYGEMIDYTDEVELFSEDTIQVRYREELGELANSRMEDLIQIDMLSTATVSYPDSVFDINELDEDAQVSYDLIRKAVRKLVRNRAMKNVTMVTGSTKIDTRTIEKAYYAIIGANIKGDLENLVRGVGPETEYVYVPAHKYGAAGTMAEGEVGAMHEVRFIESESAVVYNGQGAPVNAAGADDTYTGDLSTTTYADAAAVKLGRAGTVWDRDTDTEVTAGETNPALVYFDAFPILFPAQNCFATVGLKGMNKIKFNSKSPEKIENSNPYGTNGFFSYNFWYAGIILEEEKLLKVLTTASA